MILDLGSKSGKTFDDIKRVLQDDKIIAVDIRSNLLKQVQGPRVKADIRTIFAKPKCVDYVSLCHVLEHLENLDEVKLVITNALTYAKKAVYISGPWFDDDAYLAQFNLNLFWSTWPDHKTHLTSSTLKSILNDLGCNNWRIQGIGPLIKDSTSPRLHVVGYEAGHNYTRGIYPPKPYVKFDHDIYDNLDCMIWIR